MIRHESHELVSAVCFSLLFKTRHNLTQPNPKTQQVNIIYFRSTPNNVSLHTSRFHLHIDYIRFLQRIFYHGIYICNLIFVNERFLRVSSSLFRRKKKVSKAPKPSPPPNLDDIPDLVQVIMAEEEETGEKAAAAVKRIYELCDVWHKQNRVPMVCSGKWDVLTPLVKCLQQENDGIRHLACLALNNLSIPTENKGVMALGPVSSDVMG